MANRLAPSVPSDPRDSPVGGFAGGDHSDVGSITIAAGLAVPRQTNPRADPNIPFLQSDLVRSDVKLPAVQ